ncbi:endonuclease V [Krasilnikovia sp. MM14-A1004]|uniref:endonuclease V n=1 Tax=Krasilnikovia sp. MM14-A1004 TaxID=3373541 RepID=UPI00399D1659
MIGYEAPRDPADAERIQASLRDRLDLTDRLAVMPASVVGLDVSYEVGSPRVAAAAVVIDVATLEVRESAIAHGEAAFPYVPGLLAFREVPILLDALGMLATRPEVLICDGYGIAHPRRFGLACHLGVLTGLPSFGVAKTAFTAGFLEPGQQRGDWSPLVEGEEVLGRALRTQTGIKPVFVSVGHRVGLDQATELTLALSGRFRIPEATRKADFFSREALRNTRT